MFFALLSMMTRVLKHERVHASQFLCAIDRRERFFFTVCAKR